MKKLKTAIEAAFLFDGGVNTSREMKIDAIVLNSTLTYNQVRSELIELEKNGEIKLRSDGDSILFSLTDAYQTLT